MGIEALLPQTRIKRLDVRIIRRGRRSRKDQLDLIPIRPLVQRDRGEFWTIIDSNFLWCRSPPGHAGQGLRYLDTPKMRPDPDVYTLTTKVIDYC